MRRAILCLLVASFAAESVAVSEPAPQLSPNAVYAELGGGALLYSVNYERLIVPSISVRVGFSYDSVNGICGHSSGCTWIQGSPSAANNPNATLWQVPITVSYLGFRKGRHILELGGGGAFTYVGNSTQASGAGAYIAGLVGYRFHPLDRTGFQFRGGLSLALGNFGSGGLGFSPWPYVSVGFAF